MSKKLKDITEKNAKRVLQDIIDIMYTTDKHKEDRVINLLDYYVDDRDTVELKGVTDALLEIRKFCYNHAFCSKCPLSEKINYISGWSDYKCAMSRVAPFHYDQVANLLNKKES